MNKQNNSKKPIFYDIHFALNYVFSGPHFITSKILGREGMHYSATL
jgi:hypothetical protein